MTLGQFALWLLIFGLLVAMAIYRWRHDGGTSSPRWRSLVVAFAILFVAFVGLFLLQATAAPEIPWWYTGMLLGGMGVFLYALWLERGQPW